MIVQLDYIDFVYHVDVLKCHDHLYHRHEQHKHIERKRARITLFDVKPARHGLTIFLHAQLKLAQR